jgi:hypothetical protein
MTLHHFLLTIMLALTPSMLVLGFSLYDLDGLT